MMFKTGTAVVIKTQEELNELASLSGQFELDSIIVEGDMFAYQDEISAICVEPMVDFDERNFSHLYKKFKNWKRGIK